MRLKMNLLHIEPGLKEPPKWVFIIMLPSKNLSNTTEVDLSVILFQNPEFQFEEAFQE